MLDRDNIRNLRIDGISKDEIEKVKWYWDYIAKPLDGLGDYEWITARIGVINQDETIRLDKRALVIMCADNGIIEEGVSQSDSSVTAEVAKAMGQGKSSVCAMAGINNVDVIPVDIGIKDVEAVDNVRDCKLSKGTANFLKEPAMSEEMVLAAIDTGISIVRELKASGYQIIATGEMGIGNTTTSSAVASAILGLDAGEMTGRGAGLDSAGLTRKIDIINEAIKKYDLYNQDAFDILRYVGGLDIAGLTGVFIGGAIYRVPVIIDGLISATAALVADRMVCGCRDYFIASHQGREKGIQKILSDLGLEALIGGNMALGEGTGGIMMLSLLDMVLAVYHNANKFDDIDVEQYVRLV